MKKLDVNFDTKDLNDVKNSSRISDEKKNNVVTGKMMNISIVLSISIMAMKCNQRTSK